jgi:hypothetical protein
MSVVKGGMRDVTRCSLRTFRQQCSHCSFAKGKLFSSKYQQAKCERYSILTRLVTFAAHLTLHAGISYPFESYAISNLDRVIQTMLANCYNMSNALPAFVVYHQPLHGSTSPKNTLNYLMPANSRYGWLTFPVAKFCMKIGVTDTSVLQFDETFARR